MHVQRRTIEGVLAVAGPAPTRAISIPLLPKEGAWSITGHVIAVDEATPRSSATYYPRFRGTCAAGVVTPANMAKSVSLSGKSAVQSAAASAVASSAAASSSTVKSTTQPADNTAQPWEPGGLSLTATGQQLEIEVAGIEGKTIVWAWALDVVVVVLGDG